MNKLKSFLIVFFLVLPAFAGPAQKPEKHPGFYMDSDENVDKINLPFYFWFLYKTLFPIKTAPASIENYFKTQNHYFGKPGSETVTISRAKIVAVGDIMVETKMTRQNSPHLFDDISREISSADIAFGNLEGPAVPNRKVSTFPKYNCRAELVQFYKEQGFDVVSTGNNHCLDQGPDGLIATLDYLDQLGIRHTGTARTLEERDQDIPIMDANGVKVAFISYTYGVNGRNIPKDKPWSVNLVDFNRIKGDPDLSLIKKDIQTARKKGAEVVIVSPHWGLEYEFYPTERIISRGHQIIEMGADIILGHHPHNLQPMEKYIPKNPDRVGLPETFIVYSLSNFIPDQPQLEFRTSVVLGIVLETANSASKKQIRISKIELTPIFFYSGKEYRLIRIDRALAQNNNPEYSFLKPKDRKHLEQAKQLIQDLFLPGNASIESFLPQP